jgi:phosphate starvation-inducible protein PhoH
MRKKTSSVKKENHAQVKVITPITDNQKEVFNHYSKQNNLILFGSAGTGKTFISLYLALQEIESSKVRNNIVIVRSAVPARDTGFLPGDVKEKNAIYELPYRQIVNELYEKGDAYEILKTKNFIRFVNTSYLRGITLDNSVVIVDEVQNMSFEEISTIMTRLGKNSKIIFCGDTKQNDLVLSKRKEISGFPKLLGIAETIKSFKLIKFNRNDIVRSETVKQWIIACEEFETYRTSQY